MTSIRLRSLLALAGLAFSASALAAPEAYSIDNSHTFPRFAYSHFGYSIQQHRFNTALHHTRFCGTSTKI